MKLLKLSPNISPRGYQQSIFANAMNKNTLVVLPTGLGKTVVALMLSIYYFNKNNKKILFLAPTKPLVEQQKKSFESSFQNSKDISFQILTGEKGPDKRKEMYNSDFIFSTPQVIENDLISGIIKKEEFGFVIFDECHRATGNYAYTFIASEFSKSFAKFLGLSASPGVSKEDIEKILEILHVEKVEVKSYDDPEIKEFVKQTSIEKIKVELPEELKSVCSKLKRAFDKKLSRLNELGFKPNKNSNYASKKDLLDLQIELRKNLSGGSTHEDTFKALSVAAGMMKLYYGLELVESQEVSVAYNYFHNMLRDGGDMSKAAKDLALDIDFREAYEILKELNSKGVKHPKLLKLREKVFFEFEKNSDLRVIIFSQYRESAQIIVEELSKVREIRPVLFIGQAKKGDFKLSQKEQKLVLERFREGDYNVLVSTSVGEEGLDIPKVDCVFFYEPVASAIRSIQRIGRTGRFNDGRAYIMITDGTKDTVTGHIANAKEKKMKRVLDEIKKEYDSKSSSLKQFIDNNDGTSIKISGEDSNLPLIYVDSRENSDLIKEFHKLPIRFEVKRLDVSDIVVSDQIGIERKSKSDFVSSILDKRLFPQLIDLSKNFRRPILIIEGEENIFTLRNLNPNVIRATLSAIAVDMRIPIIYTDSIEDTSQMVLTIAKRTLKSKKDISLVMEKRSFSENEELEKFVSSIPKINVVSAKSILKHFNSINNLVSASEENLVACEGIGKIRAKFLKEFFEREYKNL